MDITCGMSFREFFNGIKNNKWSRSFTMLYFLRRFVYVLIVIWLRDKSISFKVGLITAFQIPYLIGICLMRPFDMAKDNFCEILNEIIITMLFASHFYLQEKPEWSTYITYTYMWSIIVNNIIAMLIAFCTDLSVWP